MYYSLVNFPKIKGEKINLIRRKYDPLEKLINYHITLIFPIKFPCEISEEELISHIESKLRKFKAFDVRLAELKKAWDNWLFLLAKEGNPEIIKLHDALYTKILEKYLRKDIEYTPHVTIGLFTKKDAEYDVTNPKIAPLDEDKYRKALDEAQKLELDYKFRFNNLALIKLNDEFTSCEIVKEFKLD